MISPYGGGGIIMEQMDVLVLCSDMNSPPWDFSEIIHIVVYIYYMFREFDVA